MEKIHELIKICKKSQSELKLWLRNEMLKYYSAKKIKLQEKYLYVKGTLPICCVAHLDTVHLTDPVQFYYDPCQKHLFSPTGIGGDDRCGVYIILELLKAGYRPSIIFCCDEEIGGIGATEFTKVYADVRNVNWFLEFDRRGKNDVVCYDDDNEELTKVFEQYGFKSSYGSFSDISILAPFYKKSAVNISSGYYNAHTKSEYISMDDLDWIIETVKQVLDSEYVNVAYEYKESVKYQYYYDAVYKKGVYKYNGRDYSSQYVPSVSANNSGHCAVCQRWKYKLVESEYGSTCEDCVTYYGMKYCNNCGLYVWVGEDNKCDLCGCIV